MAKRKKRPQTATHHEQPKVSVEKPNRKLWYTLSGVALIGLIIAWGGWYVRVGGSSSPETIDKKTSRTARKSQHTTPESQQPIKETSPITPPKTSSQKSDIRRGSQGYVKWQTQENELEDGKKQIEGTIYWNEKTGANNEPAIGMPLHLATADHEKKELIVIATGITDENGQFTLIVPATGDIRLGCDFAMARNVPHQVILSEQRKNRSAEDQQLIEKLVNLEGKVNSETTWGSKVNRWINEQGTSVYVDYSGPASAWYDSKTD